MERQRNREEFGENGIEDMINILELTEQNLLRNLRIRYDKELIYTYTGSILVAVNPYKMFNIYGVDVVRKYEGQVLDQQPPHLFAIGSNSYSKMVSDNENQVIVISGESGAGKTESTKLLMQYLAAVNKSGTNIITERILEANPLLESFGNAKTVKNDNSSRFGKYVELYFKSGSILGAKTSDYLLEKSRIVSQAANERNYHVFYEMLVGLSGAEKQKYGLQSAENYFYLNQGGATRIQGKDDLRDYQNLTASLNVLGFTAIEQETIIKMLASVLHIGNVYFTQVQSQHHSAGVKIDSEDQIKWVCHLLGLNQDWLHSALTTKVTEARDERLRSPLTIDQAVESRDAVAKALYQRLFSWLVERVNHIVRGHSHERTSSLAILDIFGFEDFKQNSLEQFCINYANESLQYYFNKHIFKLEQEIYRRERINWSQIRFHDNQPTLDLISKKREGIIYLLDDESNFPKATDQSFLEKCHRTHTGNSLYEKPRMSAPQFGIKHYAGLVTYNVKHFLDKNKDTLRSDVVELLIQSKNQIISKMFSDLKDSTVSKTISKTSGFYVKMRPKTATVAASFHESLTTLVDAMAKCNPWFVRCIKPNDGKSAMVFDDQVVLSQLRYTGMLETINIRKMGYPIRYRFKVFADRYFVLLGRRNRGPSTLSDDKALCEAVLRQQGRSWEQFWAVGVSKLFLKESLNNELERARNQMIAGAVLVLQQYSRGYLARKRYLRTRHAAIMLQSGLRRWRARTNYLAVRKGVVRAQAQFRMMLQRRRYEKLKAEYRRRLEADARNRAEEQRRRDEDRRRNRVISQRPAAAAPAAAAGDVPLPSNRITRSSSFSSSVGSLSGSMAVAHLEIPSELGYIFSKIEEWRPSHTDQHVNESSAPVELRDLELKLPHDINSYEMLKYVNVFCKEPDLKRTQFPIKSPFLDTRNDADVKEALAIFKLILRYMGDANLGDKKQKVIADYIVQKGQVNENLRDEIYIQMINQTLGLKNEQAQEKGWMLISNCLSCFQPSSTFFKYLLKYVTDHAYNGYKLHCQHKLLQCMEIPPQLNRVYLPTQLEWKAAKHRSCMGLNAFCGDGLEGTYHVESWTTAQEFAAHVLHTKGINEGRHGWTVALRDGEDVYECGGYDYVLDLIGEMELPPAFPFCRSYFLVTSDRSKDHTRRAQYTNMPHHPDNPRLMPMPTEELNQPVPASPRPAPPAGTFFNYPSVASSLNGDYLSREDLLSTNVLNRREAGAPNPDLSKESILNIRYVRRPPSMAPESASSTLTRDTAAPEAPPLATDSKMNQRYITPVDLPKSKLNQRYTIAQDTFFTNGDVVTGAPNGEQNGHVSNGEDWDTRNGSKFAKGPNAVRASMPPMDHSARDQILRKGRPIKTGRSGSEVSDLDRWVDDVFDRVLDGSVDDVDNPQHLEHRLKGGGDDPFSLQPNTTLINTGVPAGSTTFPVNMTTFPVLPGAGTSIPVGDPTQQLLAQQMAAQQYAAQQQFLQQQQQARAVQQAAAAQQFAAQQMAQQHLDQQQQQQQLLMARQADPTRVMKAQLATKNLENELLLKDIEQKKLKKELAALANASLRNSGSSAGAPAVSALHFDLPPSARSPPAQPPTPAYSLPSPQVVSPALPAQPAEIDTSRPGGVKTLKGVFEKKRKDVGDAFTRQSVLQSIRTHPPQEAKVSFSTRVDSIPQPTPTSPPTPAAPTSKSPPLPQPPSPAVSPRPPSPAVSPPPAQRSSSSPGPPTAPPPPPIQTSAMKDESGEGPIKVATGGTRRFKNNGKFQWPPPKEEERREEPLVGKLEIQERREESIRRKAPRTSTSGDGAVKVDVGSKIDMKSRQKEIESKLNQAWGKSTENLADVPPKVISPRPLSPRLAAGKREKPPTPPQLPPPPPPPQIPTEPAQPAPVPVSSPAPPPPQPRKLEQPEPMFDLKSLERIQSVLYAQNTGPFYTYRNVNWNLEVRKEVFTPSENPEDPVIINLIFAQIVMDCISTACIRIQKEDKIKMNSILENAGISRRNVLDEHPLQVKKDVIETAREWPYYFSRLFSVNGGRQHGNVHMIGVSHSGVRLLTKEKEFKEDKLRVLRHFRFEEIKHVSVPKEHTLQIHTTEDDYVLLYTHKAEQIRDLIDAYCIECEANARYVRALKNYKTKDTTLLSFDKGDLIKLTNKNMTLDRGWLYGSAHGRIGLFPESYIQPVPLHEIPDDIYARINKNKSKVDLQSTDSLNGFIPSHNSHSKMSTTEKKIRSKKLKSEPVSNGYIIKTKAVTNGFIKAKPVSNGFLKKKNPLINGVNHMSNGGPHVKHGPRNAREEEHDHFDPVISGRKGLLRISKPYKDVRSDISSVATTSGPAKFSMLEFAMLNYRESPYRFPVGTSDSGSVHSHRNKMDSLRIKTADRVKRGSKRGDWTWKDQVALIKWTKDPIQMSLLKFESSSLNKSAIDCFHSVMRYMGDYPLSKGQKPTDCVYSILMSCHNQPNLTDEVYCQLTKQVTNNRSTKPESEQQGWRLMCILSSFFKCTPNLERYLFNFLEQAAFDTNRAHNVAAQTSLQNLRQTLRYGGRKNVPNRMEIEALTRGRNTKRQMCILPGGTPIMLNMKSSSVVQEIVMQICSMLGISEQQHQLEAEEFTIFYVIEAENRYCPLKGEEYVFDITTELSNQKKTYYLLFQRTSWVHTVNLSGNPRYIDVVYNQCIPDYLDGFLLSVVSNTLPEHMKDEIAELACLQIRCNEKPGTVQKQKEINFYIPRNVQHLTDMKPQNWTNKVNQMLTRMPHLSPVECQKEFLKIVQMWPLFGATFFNIKDVLNDNRVKGECMLAVNKSGIFFLDPKTHATRVVYRFEEIISTRRGNAREGGRDFLEVKIGDLYSQKIIRLVTDQGADISSLVTQYMRIINTSTAGVR